MRRPVAVPLAVPLLAALLATLVAAGAAAVGAPVAAAAAAPVSAPGGYVAGPPTRLVDTRVGQNVPKARIRAGQTLPAAILGHGGLPGSGVSAVQVTVTVLSPSAGGGITAFGGGSAPPTTTVQFSTGQAVSDEAIVPVAAGAIRLRDTQASGTADVVVDLQGYYLAGAPSKQGAFHPLPSAVLAVDTRTGTGVARAPLGAGRAVAVTPQGAGLPATGAVAVTITAVGPTRPGSIVAWPTGSDRPLPASLYFAANKGGSAFAVVGLVGGRLDLFNSSAAAVDVVVDVVGYYAVGVPSAAGTFGPIAASRVGAYGIGYSRAVAVRLTGNGVPRPAGTVALVSITVVSPARAGGITVYRSATARPGTTTMQFAAGQEIIGTAAVPISADGYINLYNASSGAVTVVVDVHGYLAPDSLTVPAVQKGRYPNDMTTSDVSGNVKLMGEHGCADARAGSRFVLLDIGAQSITPPTLSANNRGVVLTPTASRVPLSYTNLISAIVDGYLAEYAACAPTSTATVAVGTSNDGAFDPAQPNYYTPTARGRDWAAVINRIKSSGAAVAPRVSVVGAIDIEAAFASTESQAQQWETAYLAATPSLSLIYNGDANSCPATFGVRGATCAFGWTQAGYYALAHHGSRIQVLPQIYYPAEAVKWADIDATGGGGLIFAGALTESRDPGTNSPANGWAYLYRAISSVVVPPSTLRSVDIAPDS